MNLKLIFISLGLLLTELLTAQDQTTELSLKQVIEIARMESPDAQTARHSFRSAYWNYKYYRANYLPSLSLTSDPNLNRAINKITMGDGSVKFVEQNLLNTDLTLNLSQNLSWTGGSFFLETSAQRMDLFSEHKYSWQTSPIMIGYRQSLFGYNSLKWDNHVVGLIGGVLHRHDHVGQLAHAGGLDEDAVRVELSLHVLQRDRKSTRLNSSH